MNANRIRCRPPCVYRLSRRPLARLAALLAGLVASSPSAWANVYATNVRLNGSATSAALYIPCGEVQISYLLNEPATAGVTIDILDGTNVVHSIVRSFPERGTAQGFNAVPWNALDSHGDLVGFTTYTVRITAASLGHSEWTQISDDLNSGNYAWDPVGIAINRNTNSPCYGRVFVANASPGPNAGDRVGILKLNADGSPPSDGVHSTGDWNWSGDRYSPWKLEVSADDHLYVNDWTSNAVLRFDQQVSHDSRRLILRGDNRPDGASNSFGGLAITGSGTNTCLWMTDVSGTNGVGVRRWPLGPNGAAATNDLGVTIVQAGGESELDDAPYDVAVDLSNRLYAVQYRVASLDPSPRLLCFPPFTNSATALTNVEWKVGSGNNSRRGASGVAVDPAGKYVAVAFRGALEGSFQTGGRTIIFDTATGNVVTTIITDPPVGESHDHTDVAWDNVGNLYDLDNYESLWRVYSPPGSNAASTVATALLLVSEPPQVPILQALGHANGQFTLALTGRTNVSYVIEAAPDYSSWTPVATNISHLCPTRPITVSAPLGQSFYRAYPLP